MERLKVHGIETGFIGELPVGQVLLLFFLETDSRYPNFLSAGST